MKLHVRLIQYWPFFVLALLLMAAGWPAVNTSLPGSSGQILYNNSGVPGAKTLHCSDLADAGSGCTGSSGVGGTVTSVTTGFGLTGGPITSSGTVSMVAPASDDQVYVSDSSSSATWRTLPNCTDSAGNHLNYMASTNTWSCGTSTSGLTANQTITLSGDVSGAGTTAITVTSSKVNGVSYPSSPSTNTLPVVTGSNTVTYEAVPNAALANSAVTIAGHSISLGGSQTLACADLSDAGSGCTGTTSSGGTVTKQTCMMDVGDDDGQTLIDADLGPRGRQCLVNLAGTLAEITVAADAGTPNVTVRRNRAGSTVNLVSAALQTATAGALACSKTTSTTGLDGATSCTGTLQNTTLNAGDWIELASGTAGGVAKRMSIAVTWTVP